MKIGIFKYYRITFYQKQSPFPLKKFYYKLDTIECEIQLVPETKQKEQLANNKH